MSFLRYTMFGTCLLQSFSLTVCEADTSVASLVFLKFINNKLLKHTPKKETNKLLDLVCCRGVL